MRSLMPLTVICLGFGGCHLVFPFAATGPDVTGDLGGLPDARDATSVPPDVGVDAGDSASDGPVPDGPPPAPDQASPDMLNTTACMHGVQEVIFDKAAICIAPFPVNQCDCNTPADSVCNLAAGWSFCPATVYKQQLDQRQKIEPGYVPSVPAWVAGCIKQTFGPFLAPGTTRCSTCATTATCGADTDFSWDCTGNNPLQTSLCPLGVVTDSVCRRLGINDPSTASWWIEAKTVLKLGHAVCCES